MAARVVSVSNVSVAGSGMTVMVPSTLRLDVSQSRLPGSSGRKYE